LALALQTALEKTIKLLMKRLILLAFTCLLTLAISAQKTKTNTAKLDFTQFPSVPVEGVKSIGIEVYTADLPFNHDTLRLYLDNIDLMKSDVERISKVDFKALNEIDILGGQGDLNIKMAFGEPSVISKEQMTTSCAPPQDGCTQFYYMVKYELPAFVQASNAEGVLDTWALESTMDLKFGNEQIETHSETDKGTVTSIQIFGFNSEVDLVTAFNSYGEDHLARKGIVTQLGNMAELIYDNVFFEDIKLKLDIAYGAGNSADYTETETAADMAVSAIEGQNYSDLSGPIATWEKWLSMYDDSDKKAAVNDKVAEGLHENLSIAYTFTEDFEKAKHHIEKALEFARTGFVSENNVDRLKQYRDFIDRHQKVRKYNAHLESKNLVEAPDIKKLIGRRKFNENLKIFVAEDKYDEMAASLPKGEPKDISEMTVEEFLSSTTTNSESAPTLEGRVENKMLIMSALVDGNFRGHPLPESICEHKDIKTIRAVNIGLTAIPSCMQELTDLEKLFLGNNSFEALPDIFGNMKNLEVLDISDNNLKTIPPSLFQLTGLKKITVSGNQFSDDDLKKLEAALPDTKFK
jgi:hypothetical protein